MKENVMQLMSEIKVFIEEKCIEGVVKLLVIEPDYTDFKDIDIFLEVDKNADRFSLICETSLFVAQMSIKFGTIISIYPILTDTIMYKENQFSINVNSLSKKY